MVWWGLKWCEVVVEWCGVLELTKVDFLFSSIDIHSFGIQWFRQTCVKQTFLALIQEFLTPGWKFWHQHRWWCWWQISGMSIKESFQVANRLFCTWFWLTMAQVTWENVKCDGFLRLGNLLLLLNEEEKIISLLIKAIFFNNPATWVRVHWKVLDYLIFQHISQVSSFT